MPSESAAAAARARIGSVVGQARVPCGQRGARADPLGAGFHTAELASGACLRMQICQPAGARGVCRLVHEKVVRNLGGQPVKIPHLVRLDELFGRVERRLERAQVDPCLNGAGQVGRQRQVELGDRLHARVLPSDGSDGDGSDDGFRLGGGFVKVRDHRNPVVVVVHGTCRACSRASSSSGAILVHAAEGRNVRAVALGPAAVHPRRRRSRVRACFPARCRILVVAQGAAATRCNLLLLERAIELVGALVEVAEHCARIGSSRGTRPDPNG
mmetsp:Transcript_45183/g.112049  ORF Transcript_45183/g.112049 Transcript_45183/m.112049 type:complete len:271 (+) Transcript_45183:166-978(+)